MLRRVKRMYGDKPGAADGQIGLVQDFHFDLQKWAILYLVANTGSQHAEAQLVAEPNRLRPVLT